MHRKEIIEKYKNKIAAIESFGSNKEIYACNLANQDDLIHHLVMLNDHEISLTDDGMNFLKEYYSFEGVAQLVLDAISKGIGFKYEKKEDIIKWLEHKGAPFSEVASF